MLTFESTLNVFSGMPKVLPSSGMDLEIGNLGGMTVVVVIVDWGRDYEDVSTFLMFVSTLDVFRLASLLIFS